ncbi:unnamed protein product [Linum trigynum]|uniref:C2H2-type domain-containing protein n=1 Tax=Linum trigynum TaxID=586398 RepID=A0AAV2CE97_9ROSI
MKNTKLSNDYPRFCQICKRLFPTGKAMGGHMRSHLALAKLPSSRHRPTATPPPQPAQLRRPDPVTLVPSSSSNNSSTSLSIINFVPPFSPDRGHSSDGYSPTGGHMTRRRSKRKRRQIQSTSSTEARSEEEEVAMCLLTLSRDPQLLDLVWKDKDKNKNQDAFAAADDNNMEASQRKGKAPIADYHDDDESCCGQYRCETCNKGFQSYQALGGHRASHNKSSSAAKSLADDGGEDEEEEEGGGGGDCDDDDDDEDYQEEEEEDQDLEVVAMNISNGVTGGGGGSGAGQAVRRQFPCSFCGKVFDSGQALGGHKKIHMSYHHHPPPPPAVTRCSTSTSTATTVDELRVPQLVFPPGGRLMIDLNSSPLDDDESDEVYQPPRVQL